eukprot:scaffold232100_cov29-Prasinocladus_malaysianus.AAC.1
MTFACKASFALIHCACGTPAHVYKQSVAVSLPMVVLLLDNKHVRRLPAVATYDIPRHSRQ